MVERTVLHRHDDDVVEPGALGRRQSQPLAGGECFGAPDSQAGGEPRRAGEEPTPRDLLLLHCAGLYGYRRQIGLASRRGTRKPRSECRRLTSGARWGGTCSKKPPHSSNVITSSVRGQSGLVVTAL